MAKIVTTSQLQKTIGQLANYMKHSWVIVTNKGKPTVIMLPYFDDNETAVADYLEDYEMYKNKTKLDARYKESMESGESNLTV